MPLVKNNHRFKRWDKNLKRISLTIILTERDSSYNNNPLSDCHAGGYKKFTESNLSVKFQSI